jgi:hypothetical protein
LDVRMLQGKADGLTQPDPMGGAHIEPTGPHAAILGGLTIGPRRSNSEIVGGIGAPGKDRPASLALDPKHDGQELISRQGLSHDRVLTACSPLSGLIHHF